jgi:hypothetical protein
LRYLWILLKLYKEMAVPTFLHWSECRTLTKQQESLIETAEIRFLISVADYRRMGQFRNETIRQ